MIPSQYTSEKINNPLQNDFVHSLIPRLTQIARSGFGTPITEQDVVNHVITGDVLYLLKNDCDVIGFSSYNMSVCAGKNILYLNGVVIERAHQQNGLFSSVNKQALHEHLPDYLVMRTQNPVIYGATKKLVNHLYPGADHVSDCIRNIAKAFGGELLDIETFVCRGQYGASLYEFIPEYPAAKSFFDNELRLDYRAGDSVILVGEVR